MSIFRRLKRLHDANKPISAPVNLNTLDQAELKADIELFLILNNSDNISDHWLLSDLGWTKESLVKRYFTVYPPKTNKWGPNFICVKCGDFRAHTAGGVTVHMSNTHDIPWDDAKAIPVLDVSEEGNPQYVTGFAAKRERDITDDYRAKSEQLQRAHEYNAMMMNSAPYPYHPGQIIPVDHKRWSQLGAGPFGGLSGSSGLIGSGLGAIGNILP